MRRAQPGVQADLRDRFCLRGTAEAEFLENLVKQAHGDSFRCEMMANSCISFLRIVKNKDQAVGSAWAVNSAVFLYGIAYGSMLMAIGFSVSGGPSILRFLCRPQTDQFMNAPGDLGG